MMTTNKIVGRISTFQCGRLLTITFSPRTSRLSGYAMTHPSSLVVITLPLRRPTGRHGALRSRPPPEDGRPDPHDRGALGDRVGEVAAHPHRQLPDQLGARHAGGDRRLPQLGERTVAGPDRAPVGGVQPDGHEPVSYTHLRAHETVLDLVC